MTSLNKSTPINCDELYFFLIISFQILDEYSYLAFIEEILSNKSSNTLQDLLNTNFKMSGLTSHKKQVKIG